MAYAPHFAQDGARPDCAGAFGSRRGWGGRGANRQGSRCPGIRTVSSDKQIGLVKEHGADEVINYATHDFAVEANRLTGGRGVDLILDAICATTMDKGLTCLAPFGHLILYGRAGGAPEPLNLFRLFEKIAQGERLRALHGGGGARGDAARNRKGIVAADHREEGENRDRQDVPASAGRGGAPLYGIAPVDWKSVVLIP